MVVRVLIASDDAPQMIWHAGAVPGVSHLVVLFPKVRTGVVVCANADGKEAPTMQVASRVLQSILKAPTDK